MTAGWHIVSLGVHARVLTICERVCRCRTPQGLRAMMRAMVAIVVPIYVGPHWAAFAVNTGSFAFVAFISCIVSRKAFNLPHETFQCNCVLQK